MFHNPGPMQDFGGFEDGGFQPGGGEFSSPGGGGMAMDKKPISQYVIPIMASHLQQIKQDGSEFRFCDTEVRQVVMVGTIISVERSQTCTTYKVDDTTGFATVKQWASLESDDDSMRMKKKAKIYEEGTLVQVVAKVRSFQKNITLNAVDLSEIEDANAIMAHPLECIKFREFKRAMKNNSNKVVMSGDAGFNPHNSSMNFNQSDVMNMGMDSVQAQVWRLIESYQGESGMHVNEIRSTLKNLNINQIKQALDFLSNEGHIYSTCDDDHFRSTS